MSFTILPAVDIRDGKAVRLERGRADAETVYDVDPVAAAERWVAAGAEWLHVVDLDAAFEGEPRNRPLISDIVAATGVPVQASGGIRSMADIEASLGYGASRVVIGTMALEEPPFVAAAVADHADRIAVGLDAEGTTLRARGWTADSGDLYAALHQFSLMGVTRFVYTDIARDGMLGGPNLDRLRQVAEATPAHVTASGGVSSIQDVRALASAHERVDAAIVGKALYAERFTLTDALAEAAAASPERPAS
ncbi:1-(5-phosphoribosyl)-5-[(5-phosphoribosylamino)methylideneamino]imidazole-4-carboxamide isomerase [Egibacter rhizosphaerae]|uniref:1-(5-phosphoribosyl)-5-[(5-phosphoribosylamino)methylideneamino] imidazole-4-carboxamide isomerase n=1 Tax=Egibacter rhizosphaerae TaxID=1670831 RepID=A0A411YKU0_9ACTN|nr:1-(5-phosphoribosyl)-5-[(5-phosphoribosylamino)methylideneamino]imidazole-4-carboxamide isomerase [Egibacter rhizosphaerae]QBI21807.1 1-(5-phosphoribosyl)-5-[(5-phosphoribosylamino)methylideneamino]imidazole-4-carboxamide isomerase [Egibacter rhizosphaerae]